MENRIHTKQSNKEGNEIPRPIAYHLKRVGDKTDGEKSDKNRSGSPIWVVTI